MENNIKEKTVSPIMLENKPQIRFHKATKTTSNQLALEPDYHNDLETEIKDILSGEFDEHFVDCDPLVLVDLFQLLVRFSFPHIQRFLGMINQCLQMTTELISDAKVIQPGDVLYTTDLKYIIVKDVSECLKESTDDRLRVDLIHVANHGYFTARFVSRDIFSISPRNSVMHVLKPDNRESTIAAAFRHVGDTIFRRCRTKLDVIQSVGCALLSMYWRCQTYTSSDIQPGDMISFLYFGICKCGIVLKKRNNLNNTLSFTFYHVNNDAIITENQTDLDLDQTKVTRCNYTDFDSVIRRRILHTAELMQGQSIAQSIFTRSLSLVLGCISGDIVVSRKFPIFVGLQTLQLSTETFTRIENIKEWLKKHSCLHFPKEVEIPQINLETTILVISNKYTTNAWAQYFEEENILKRETELLSCPSIAVERIFTRLNNDLNNKIFIIELHPDENEVLPLQDRKLLVSMKEIIKRHDTVFTIPTFDNAGDVCLSVSKTVKDILDPKSPTNLYYNRVFHYKDSDTKKRISLYAERQINRQTNDCADNLNALIKGKQDDNMNMTLNDSVRKAINTLKPFTTNKKPDICERHIIEILLQRHEHAPAYSCIDGKIKVFTNDKESLQPYLRSFLPAFLFHLVEFSEWHGKPEISIRHLKQGSKIIPSKEQEQKYGTLGFFLRDEDGGIYFTTCGHVLRSGEEAFTKTDLGMSVVGKSIYSPQEQRFSITEELDLSLVKVKEDKIANCGFGIRNCDDKLVKGTILAADASEMEDKNIYKWGARTQLTRGIYKGSLFVKKGAKFSSYLHHIKGNINHKEFAEGGDSGSLICFEATESPQFQGETAALIFIGECQSGTEYASTEFFTSACYHVNDVFTCCKVEHTSPLKANFTPNELSNTLQSGASVIPST